MPESSSVEPRRAAGPQDSLTSLLGGRGAAVDATLPPVGFVVGWLAAGQSIGWGAGVAIAVAVLTGGYRLARREKPRAVVISIAFVTVGALIALHTGRAADFFLLQLLSNVASALLWMVSIVLRWPLLGLIVGTVLGQRTRWRRDPALRRAYQWASWVWVGQYVLRVLVYVPLWLADDTVALGVARVVLSWPLQVACLSVSGVVFVRRLPRDHPGIRHPVTPESPESPEPSEAEGSGDGVSGKGVVGGGVDEQGGEPGGARGSVAGQ